MVVSIMVVMLLAALTVLAKPGTLQIERVFGPEIPTGPYKHPATLTELANGDLYLVYYGGQGEYAIDTGVFGARWERSTGSWSSPHLIAQDPFRSVGNGVIWQAPDGIVWLFYVVRWGDTWSTSKLQAKISRDGAQTWSDSFVLSEEMGMMVRGHPIVLDTGEYLLPVYHETGHDTEVVGADSTSRFLRFDPQANALQANAAQTNAPQANPLQAKTWRPSGIISSAKGNIQPAVVQLTHAHLIAYCRRGGGYDPVTDGYIIRSESRDGGWTWSEGQDTLFPNPNSAIDLLKLQSGHLLLVYNDSMNERTPLTAALSEEGDQNWSHRRNIAIGPYDYAYPYAIQAQDGEIHLVYTSHERTVISHAVFDEAWVQDG